MITRVASSAGPLLATAAMQTVIKAPEVPMTSTCPVPIRPMRNACSTVVVPQTATEASTAHDT